MRTMPTDHEEIVRFMRSNNAFMHPTVVFRSSALANVGHYPLTIPAELRVLLVVPSGRKGRQPRGRAHHLRGRSEKHFTG